MQRPREDTGDLSDATEDGDEPRRASQRRRTDDADADMMASTSTHAYREEEEEEEEFSMSQTDNPQPRTPQGQPNQQGDPLRRRHPKSIQDRVHGQITLDGLLIAVMDTSEFQRLDRIKQLGGSVHVYPSATHSRKEHSIGVAYLAGMMARHLAEEQPELGIDAADILCVELAGLVHDIGHGPFSHMFETFMKIRAAETGAAENEWHHENMSRGLFRMLLERNRIPIWEYFGDSNERVEQHINFAERLIDGLKDKEKWPDNLGRPETKRFLFDIVSNSRNGIDVDKLDYLVRDSMACFGSPKPPGFDIYRIIKSSRVMLRNNDPNQPEVCFQMKNALEICEIYSLRGKLHRCVYQHRIAGVAEAMITDIFLASDQHFVLRGSHDRPMPLSRAAHDLVAFARLNDSILDAIDLSVEPGLARAHELIDALKRREFYVQIGTQITIDILPRCSSCGQKTRIEDRFCSACCASTVHRKKTLNLAKKRGWYVTEGQILTPAAATKEILDRCEQPARDAIRSANALHVHIQEIAHGKATSRKDPHGIEWEVYDPLASVGFYNPKELDDDGHQKGTIHRMSRDKLPGDALPEAHLSRTLYCFLRQEGNTQGLSWRFALEQAIKLFRKDRVLCEQQGTSNIASPAHLNSNTPRGGAVARAPPKACANDLTSVPENSARLFDDP